MPGGAQRNSITVVGISITTKKLFVVAYKDYCADSDSDEDSKNEKGAAEMFGLPYAVR